MANHPFGPKHLQPAPRPGMWTWVHDRFTYPLLSSALFALGVFGLSQLPLKLDGCDEQARTVVEAGEAAFLRGEVRNAELIAGQALALAPSCACGHLLASKVKHLQMQAAIKMGEIKRAQAVKQECYFHVIRSGRSDPEVTALRNACSAARKSNI